MGVLKIYMLMGVLGASTSVTIHSVGSLRKTGSVRCGSKVTFVCSIPTYKYTMKWLIDSDKVAECVTTNCVQYPPYKVDNIGFSPDTSNGEFNMTINQVTFKADGLNIKSSSGSESDQLKLAVKVLPRRNTTEIVESVDSNRNMINITVMTGCVFPSSAISMQWNYYEEGHKPKLYKKSSPTEATIFSVCSSGTCGGNGVVKISSTLSIPDGHNGKEYFFQIEIRHEDTGDVVFVNSKRSYKLNEISSEIDQETDLADVVLALGTSAALLLLSVAIVLAYKCRRKLLNLRRNRQPTHKITVRTDQRFANTENKDKTALTEIRKDSDAVTKLLDDQDEINKEENNYDSSRNDSTSTQETEHEQSTTDLIVDRSKDSEKKDKTALKETSRDSDAVTKRFHDPDEVNEERNNYDSSRNESTPTQETEHERNSQPHPSAANIIVHGIKDTENEHKTDITETRKASVANLLDDSNKTIEEEYNADSGGNDSASIHMQTSRVTKKLT